MAENCGNRLCLASALCALVVMAGVVTQPPAPAFAGAIAIPPSIDATGRTDVSANMAAFFARVPDGARVVFAPHGRYRMDETLVLDHRHHLTIDGNGATIFATTPGDAHRANVRVVRSSDIVIRRLAVVGANPHAGTSLAAYVPAKEHQHGFELLAVDGVVLDGVAASDTYGDFVYIGLQNGLWSNHVTVRNSVFARNGRQGIAFTAARNVVIEHNYIGDVRRATFDFEPMGNTAGVSNVVISDNVIGAGRLDFVAAAGSAAVSHVQILRNRLHAQALEMAIRHQHSHYRDDWKIIGNTSDATVGNPLGAAMQIAHVDGLEIAGNVQHLQKGRNMVLAAIYDSCHVTVRDNVLYNAVGTIRASGGC